ncbi:TIGR04222 domain-containing membrane protein [Streptomyces sp. V2]|uniref:TIGR04222 domain-containing membrane protein n=1 Tax=Streptomyces niveiscabiei TaxID=164115 RepID=A0ABW9HM23_9ACTN|nr:MULTISPECIES: TIGR04222 domain-containing membrane protein [Streptomyces]PWG15022.1 TIGR04222 domain-containing membrane protein [Streptomyces sp. V2]QZZ30844.1 TIGR04222 domain-containing membrane protein [Streptomyces sp. ST1015]
MFWVLLLVLAWAVAVTACTRLCLAAVRAAAVGTTAARAAETAEHTAPAHGLTLYEAAFLSGGPARVADLTLVSMASDHRLLLAHTGWATVVDPRGRDEMERSVLGAIGPEGQSPIAPVRARAATGDAVRGLADRLVSAGLAMPDGARTTVAAGLRGVRAAATAVLALGALALLLPAPNVPHTLVALWFALPLALTLSCLAMARVEIPPYTRWASPAGLRLLDTLAHDRTYLTSVAVHGIRALNEPNLRAAFTRGTHPWHE